MKQMYFSRTVQRYVRCTYKKRDRILSKMIKITFIVRPHNSISLSLSFLFLCLLFLTFQGFRVFFEHCKVLQLRS